MALALLEDVQKRVIALLNANPGVWSASVSGTVGAFPSIDEINAAIFEADSNVASQGYANSVNDSLANPFQVTTLPLTDGDQVPFHHGDISKVELSWSTPTFTTITVANQIPITVHGLSTGDLVSFVTTGTLPTGILAGTNYYVIVITPNIISLATSMRNALAGVATSITISTGSGIHTLIAWQIGVEAKSVDDITNAVNGMNAYLGGDAYNFLYKPADGVLYTPALYWRATHFEYVRTAVLQCNQNETSLLVFESCALLVKNASPALFQTYSAYAQQGIQQLITDGSHTVQLEANN